MTATFSDQLSFLDCYLAVADPERTRTVLADYSNEIA